MYSRKADKILPVRLMHEAEKKQNTNELKPDTGLHTVRVPEPLLAAFAKAQDYVSQYFRERSEDPAKGYIEISGERYILVRAASMSREFFDLVSSLYHDRGEKEARNITFGFLFDIAHSIGKADARRFFDRMGVSDPIERLSAGPIHFSHTGWAFVEILPESSPTPGEDFYLIYDHPFSFEAHTWLESGRTSDFPVCAMNAGYSSGWCEESFGIHLVAAEIECRAKGDDHCRFIMAPPSRIKERIARYSEQARVRPADFGSVDIPEFFQRKRLEDELLKSEKTVRALLNAPKDRAVLLDTEGRIIALNKPAALAFGMESKALIGRNIFDLFPPRIADSRRAGHEKVVKTGRSLRYEDMRDGRWMDTTVDPVLDAHGRVARVAVFSRDMTDYKTMQEALGKEKEFNATLIQTSPAFFVAIAADGRTLLMNEAMLKTLGYTQEEVIGKHYLSAFVPREEWPVLQEGFESRPTDGLMVHENRMITKKGGRVIVEWHPRRILKEDGSLDFFFAIGIDVTKRRQAEEELLEHRDHLEDLVRERTEKLSLTNEQLQKEINERKQAEWALQQSETLLRAIFDQTFQFIGILGLDGTVVKVNKTARDFVRTDDSVIAGMPFWETPWWAHSRKEQERLKAGVSKAARGELVRFETTHATPEGDIVHMDVSLKPVLDENRQITLILCEGRDITDLKLAVEDLRKREHELKSKSKSLEEANIALKVFLKQVEEKKREDQDTVCANLKQLVLPYIERLKKSRMGPEESGLLATLETNIKTITSPLIQKLSSTALGLTPMEIRVSHLIREGLVNKEISELLGISLNTVSSHRYHIRTKLGLKSNGTNLRSYLLSLEE